MYLNLYIALSLGLILFSVLMVFLALRKRHSSEESHANVLHLMSGIPEDDNKNENLNAAPFKGEKEK